MTAPVDVIWGTGDELFLKEDQELLQLSLSNADLQTLDINGATHNIHWDSKNICQQVADEIIRFVNEK